MNPLALNDWEPYLAAKAKRTGRFSRDRGAAIKEFKITNPEQQKRLLLRARNGNAVCRRNQGVLANNFFNAFFPAQLASSHERN